MAPRFGSDALENGKYFSHQQLVHNLPVVIDLKWRIKLMLRREYQESIVSSKHRGHQAAVRSRLAGCDGDAGHTLYQCSQLSSKKYYVTAFVWPGCR
jgi:hypothetical protein